MVGAPEVGARVVNIGSTTLDVLDTSGVDEDPVICALSMEVVVTEDPETGVANTVVDAAPIAIELVPVGEVGILVVGSIMVGVPCFPEVDVAEPIMRVFDAVVVGCDVDDAGSVAIAIGVVGDPEFGVGVVDIGSTDIHVLVMEVDACSVV